MEIASITVAGKQVASIDAAIDVLDKTAQQAVQGGMERSVKVLVETLDKIYAEVAKQHGNPWPTGTGPRSLSSRSGGGLQSIKDSIKVTAGPPFQIIEGRISTAKMTVHETGAVITPRRAKYLTIPLGEALDSRGVPIKRSAREWDNTFVQRSRRGNLIIFRKLSRDRIVPLYLLKDRVRLPARLGMGETVDRNIPYFAEKVIAAFEREFDR
jgi:hypothetical protein